MLEHWSTKDKPVMLCGYPVTPESWKDGIVKDDDGLYKVWDKYIDDIVPMELKPEYRNWGNDILDCEYPEDYQPVSRQEATEHHNQYTLIFPPPGWNGLTIEQVLKELDPNPFRDLDLYESMDWIAFEHYPSGMCDVVLDGRVSPKELPALIQALSNAAILAECIGGWKNEKQ